MALNRTVLSLMGLAILAGCAASGPATPARSASAAAPMPAASAPDLQLSLLAINDFHGQLQDKDPTPTRVRIRDPKDSSRQIMVPGGGIAYLATMLDRLRAKDPQALFVAAGDLIGASPLTSMLLKDEPTLQAMSDIGLSASALGNHELDAGMAELQRKMAGRCPAEGCAFPSFKTPTFQYLAANMVQADTGQPVLQPWKMVESRGVKVGLIGAITLDTPKVTMSRNVQGLRFTDEAEAINAQVPAVKAAGADLIVVLIHEGGATKAGPNNPGMQCDEMAGRIKGISEKLDPSVVAIVSGHTHQAYTCWMHGRVVSQGGSYGAYVTEYGFVLDGVTRKLKQTTVVNHAVAQERLAPNAKLAELLALANARTAEMRLEPVTRLSQPLEKRLLGGRYDSILGNVIADAQLAAAREQDPGVQLALMNVGGIRSELPATPGRYLTMAEVFAVQPFGNDLVALTLTGKELRQALRESVSRRDGEPMPVQVSGTLQYAFSDLPSGERVISRLLLNGREVRDEDEIRVVANNFITDGGEMPVFKTLDAQRARKTGVGSDVGALKQYLKAQGDQAFNKAQAARIQRQ